MKKLNSLEASALAGRIYKDIQSVINEKNKEGWKTYEESKKSPESEGNKILTHVVEKFPDIVNSSSVWRSLQNILLSYKVELYKPLELKTTEKQIKQTIILLQSQKEFKDLEDLIKEVKQEIDK